MASFVDQCREAFAELGRPLTRRDATPEREVAQAEKRLGVRTPATLREFFRVAGRVMDAHSAHDVLMKPDEWELAQGRLVFRDENQSVVCYGCRPEAGDDPLVWMSECGGGHEGRWYKICGSASEFLLNTLHWEAAFAGSLGHSAHGSVRPGFSGTLRRRGWREIGFVNGMRAFRKDGCSACVLRWGDDGWLLHLGAASANTLAAGVAALGVPMEVRESAAAR